MDLKSYLKQIEKFLKENKFKGIIILGAPVKVENSLFNCALVIQGDLILGIIPKSFLPNSGEFREKRYFKTDYDFDSIIYASTFLTAPLISSIFFSISPR